jgi:hypothetical protein
MRIVALLSLLFVSISAVSDEPPAGIAALMFDHHRVEVDAVSNALMLSPLGRDYAYEVMKVRTHHGESYLLRVNKGGYSTRGYIVDELSNFAPEIMDLIYILYPEDLQPDNAPSLSDDFAVACISKFKLNNKLINVRCYRAYRAIESAKGMVNTGILNR